jgi:hypothetical protein
VLVTVLHILCASVLSTHTHIHVHKCTMSLCHYYLQLYIFCFAFVWSLFLFPSLFSFQFFLTLFLLFPHSFSGAFRTLGATEAKLSDNLKRIFLELLEEKSACGDFDTQSLSLAVFSIAHIGKLRRRAFLHSLSTLSSLNNFTSLHLIYPSASFSSSLPSFLLSLSLLLSLPPSPPPPGFTWEHSLSALCRVSLRFCVVDCAPTFSSKEFYWSIMGLAKMVKLKNKNKICDPFLSTLFVIILPVISLQVYENRFLPLHAHLSICQSNHLSVGLSAVKVVKLGLI